jgi:hypothetical protein
MMFLPDFISWGVFPGVKQPGHGVYPHRHVVLQLRMSGAIPLLPLYALMMWPGTTLLLYGLFNAIRSSDYIASNIRVMNE